MKQGNKITPTRVNRHSSASMIAIVAATVITLVTKATMVLLMAFCAPTTSLLSRLISSPVLVLVKKRKDICCKWRYSATRRS